MTGDELKRLIQGPIATVPTAFDDRFRVDFGRMAAETQYWVESGLVKGKSVIKVAAAMGEGPMLREDEWPHLLQTVVQAAKGRAAVVCGIHYKDTVRTIDDARRAQDLGAIGLQISPPVFNWPNQDDVLRYYDAVSCAIDIGIMIYNTHWLPGGGVAPETIRKMADFQHVVAIKWTVPKTVDYDEMATFSHLFNVIDNTGQLARCFRLGGRGYINHTAEVYPPHDLRIWELLENGRYDEAQALRDSVEKPLGEFAARVGRRSGGEARLKKALVAVMGHPMGDSRPPALPLTDDEMAELRELVASFGWPVARTPVGAAADGRDNLARTGLPEGMLKDKEAPSAGGSDEC